MHLLPHLGPLHSFLMLRALLLRNERSGGACPLAPALLPHNVPGVQFHSFMCSSTHWADRGSLSVPHIQGTVLDCWASEANRCRGEVPLLAGVLNPLKDVGRLLIV